MNERSVWCTFARAVEDFGLHDLHFHDLRHEAICGLLSAGYRIEQHGPSPQWCREHGVDVLPYVRRREQRRRSPDPGGKEGS